MRQVDYQVGELCIYEWNDVSGMLIVESAHENEIGIPPTHLEPRHILFIYPVLEAVTPGVLLLVIERLNQLTVHMLKTFHPPLLPEHLRHNPNASGEQSN